MKKNQGFTLVELVIVIVILGILAVTAAPKFLNLSSDAKVSTLKAVKASIQSANAQVYAKALIASKQKEATHATTNPAINLVYGYVAATAADMTAALDLDTTEWVIAQGISNAGLNVAATDVTIRPATSTALDGSTPATQACALVYTAAANATSKPVITLLEGGC